METTTKKGNPWPGVILLILLIWGGCEFCGDDDPKPVDISANSMVGAEPEKKEEEKPVDSAARAANYVRIIDEDIASFKNLGEAKDEVTKDGILSHINQFEEMADLISMYRIETDTAIQTRLALVKKILIPRQKKDFPVLRRNYVKWANNEAWEQDMKVKGGGTTITFVHRSFAANKNIKSSYETLQEMLLKLRFKQVNFMWYDGSEYTYYKIESKGDGEL
jgi:hypothetical protein